MRQYNTVRNPQRQALVILLRWVAIVWCVSAVLPGTPPSAPSASTAQAQSASSLTWQYVNAMSTPRCCFTATPLNSGQLLVIGGNSTGGSAIATAELYDPGQDKWTPTGSMSEVRQQHSATLLPDGRVLVAGGVVNSDVSTVKATAEIYNPATGTFSLTGSLHVARANHFAVLLRNGLVLIGGGYTNGSTIASAELYNPATGVWTNAPAIPWAAQQQTATLLNDGTVLVAGGDGTNNAALYFPATNTWQSVAGMNYGRAGNMATLLNDGRVLVTGLFALQADIYNPVTRTWLLSKNVITPRLGETAALLPNGQVMITGGRTTWTGSVVDSTEIYNPATNEWLPGPRMNQTRENHVSVMLPNRYLLVIGGEQNGSIYSTVEHYGPITELLGCSAASLVILENTSCQLSISFSTLDVNSSRFHISATTSQPDLIPTSGLVFGGTGAARTLTITPAKTKALSSPTRQGQAIITITGDDGTRQETLPSLQVTITPPPWLAMLYLNADDGPLGGANAPRFASIEPAVKQLMQRLGEMTFNPAMRLVVVVDYHDVNNDSQVFVRDPDGLTDVTAKLAADKSAWPGFSRELNTADPATVRGFVTWARRAYPASTYTFLSLVDHGGGWAPDLNDGTPTQPRGIRVTQAGGWRGMSIDFTGDGATATRGQSMSTKDTHRALQDLGVDVVFFDACLMGMLESAYEVRNDAQYLIAGQNQLFAVFPYDQYLSNARLSSSTPPRDLATTITLTYNSSVSSELNPFTIAAIDLRQLRSTNQANLPALVDALAQQLLAALPGGSNPIPVSDPVLKAIQQAYTDTLKFDYDSSLTLDQTEGYVDLKGFAQQLRNSNVLPPAVIGAARDVVDAMNEGDGYAVARINPKDGTYQGIRMNFALAGGLSIYLPLGEQDYRPTLVDPNNLFCPAKPEAQLPYYMNPAQLAFTADYPNWAKLLSRLEPNVLTRRAPLPEGCSPTSVAQLVDSSIRVDTRQFTSPVQLAVQLSGVNHAFLPLIRR